MWHACLLSLGPVRRRTFVFLSFSSVSSVSSVAAADGPSHKRIRNRSPETQRPPRHFSAPSWFSFPEICTSQGRRGRTAIITNNPSLSGSQHEVISQAPARLWRAGRALQPPPPPPTQGPGDAAVTTSKPVRSHSGGRGSPPGN